MRFPLKHFSGIIIPLAFLLAMGIAHKHVGLIIGSLILGFEGLYVIIIMMKKGRKGG